MNLSENAASVVKKITETGKAFFYTKGFSMLPMLKEDRDISVLVPINQKLRRGDVVLFVRRKKDDELVLHRIIRRLPDGTYIIRGDNTYTDEPVKESDILARLDGFFRKGRYFDCRKSKRYRVYSFFRMFFYPTRRFVRKTLRTALAKVKNNVFHLYNIHLNDILGIKR